MRIYGALLGSVAIHWLIFSAIVPPIVAVTQTERSSTLRVRLSTSGQAGVNVASKATSPVVTSHPVETNLPQSSETVIHQATLTSSLENPRKYQQQDSSPWASYFPSDQVNSKAIRNSSIDISQLQDLNVSSFLLKFRLYINAHGYVTKVELLDSNDSSGPIQQALLDLLSQMTFLPAIKEGEYVDSYEDVELQWPIVSAEPSQIVLPH